ncbi:MAG: CHAT domain-containing protein, partial [Cyanobacteria bacterium J06632_22]
AYDSLGQYERAIQSYQSALTTFQDIGDRTSEGITLANIAHLLKEQDQPELAILFYKRSLNVRETIRGDIRGLSTDLQQSFTDTIADDYRALADLLLQQNRIPEAQRVLDLLKVQELDDYLRDVQRSSNTEAGVAYQQPEQRILDLYVEVILAAEELAQLENIPPPQLTPAQRTRLDQLQAQQDEISRSFSDFLALPKVVEALDELKLDGQPLHPETFTDLVDDLAELPTRSVLLYPLILEDRLELVLVSPDGTTARKPVPVSATDLTQAIADYGQALKDYRSDPYPLAQQLYSWLIAPLQAELNAIGTENIIYAPDGALRYIPLAALHDGERWLAERYSFSHITAASLTDFTDAPTDELRLLAGACVDCSFSFDVLGRTFSFADLPFTEPEVSLLSTLIDDNNVLLNQAMSPEEIKSQMGYYNILHLATHAAFVEGNPEESFIVFGNNSRLSLADLNNWQIPGTELVVLSACETAVGSAQLGDGREVLGLGYRMQTAGAKSTLASLWAVSDGGTQVLMNAFYSALSQGLTKTEALKAAQLALLNDDYSAVGGQRAELTVTSLDGEPLAPADDLSHPYFWAPFILIGNGL